MTVTLDRAPLTATRVRAEPVRTLLIIGSTRTDRFGPVPANRAAEQARQRDDIDLEVADLARLKLPTALMDDHERASPPDGTFTGPAGPTAAATEFYDQLVWWARALRAARKELPR